MQDKFKSWHFVVWDQADIDKLISFCTDEKVKKYFYIKHEMKNDKGKSHYHFYFILKKRLDEWELQSFTKVNHLRSFYSIGSHNSMLRYLLRGVPFEDVPNKNAFVTNMHINYKTIYGV